MESYTNVYLSYVDVGPQWIPTTSTQQAREGNGRRGCRASSSERAGKPITFDTHDSYGLGRGFFWGYAKASCRCTPCMGETLLMSHQCYSVLSWHTPRTTSLDSMVIWCIDHIYVLKATCLIFYYDTTFFELDEWNTITFVLCLYLYILQWMNVWMCVFFTYLCNKWKYKM